VSPAPLGWLGIVRLGLVQTALGAVVVLTTSTLNRVMVVELALPAMIPGLLVALHYGVQVMRPRFGHGSDKGRRRTPWIVGGMAALSAGGALAAVATATMGASVPAGLALATLAFLLIGVGVGAAGTSLLVLLAERADPTKRAAAATIVWLMMIAGFAVTAGVAGKLLEPYSPERLVAVVSGVSLAAFLLAVLAVGGVEGARGPAPARDTAGGSFRAAVLAVWAEPQARRFTVFIFVSMLAYNAQDLILEPFAGAVFGLTPGQSTQLGGLQHGGVFAGMLLVAVLATWRGSRPELLRRWMIGGCLASALALGGLGCAAAVGPAWPLRLNVFALGLANGAFAVAAIASMMALAGDGAGGRQGTRMGLWGAAQAIAFALGGFLGAVAFDLARLALASPAAAYGSVFLGEAAMFVVSAALAAAVSRDLRSAPLAARLA
jgi:BCD family chlorophyll transporter-like MFS transporter